MCIPQPDVLVKSEPKSAMLLLCVNLWSGQPFPEMSRSCQVYDTHKIALDCGHVSAWGLAETLRPGLSYRRGSLQKSRPELVQSTMQ